MSQLDQAIQDFVTKQNLILAQYQTGNINLRNDIQTLVRELLLAQKGLAVIDQGDIISKCQAGNQLTDQTGVQGTFIGNNGGLQIQILDLKGAKKVRVTGQFDVTAWPQDLSPTGIMGYFSTVINDTPRLSDFAFLGVNRWTSWTLGTAVPAANNLTFDCEALVDCSTAKFLYMIFPALVGNDDGFVSGALDINATSNYQLFA